MGPEVVQRPDRERRPPPHHLHGERRNHAAKAVDVVPFGVDLFSPPGIDAWKDRLNHSPRFRDAASSWQGHLLLMELSDTGANRSAWVVVRDGHCLEARTGHPADEASADYVLAA